MLWGSRVVIPPPGRVRVTDALHESHPGIARIKALARRYVWWPGMDSDIEAKVKKCLQCQTNQRNPTPASIHPWEWPERPWARLHADFAGPFMGHMFLLVVDARTKWLEVHPMKLATSQTTMELLRLSFATHGLPETLVTDNGSVFKSAEFEHFLKMNRIHHLTSAPYHPASNGLAERAVQSFKNAMKKTTRDSVETKVARFLLHYRVTPHSTTGISPAELLMGRRLRTHLDLLRPNVAKRVQRNQEKQKEGHDRSVPDRNFAEGDRVWVKNFSPGTRTRWLSGTVKEIQGARLFLVELQDGRIVRRHLDQVRSRSVAPDPSTASPESEDDWVDLSPADSTPVSMSAEQRPMDVPQPRRSTRPRRPPERLIEQPGR